MRAIPVSQVRTKVMVAFWSALACLLLATGAGRAAEVSDFVGDYTGSADVVSADGSTITRDMSVSISETKHGFIVQWTSATHKPDGRIKEKSYSIDFVPSDREGIYAAAMTRNVFGHAVQLDPMKGEPFVWGRITGDTMTVYSLFVDDEGGYELQQFDRTLAEGGLMLDFTNLRNGDKQRSVSTFLAKQ
ncbi:hypothetical protein LCL97_15060 [Seohaeicola saemankumensis]|nr:hypothetical protein [Seohaeicola saemankumensis]MCA0872159.1 hypothetical protein [Seohaeicola saemankumensis]